jgi:hypothetical protein
MTQGQTTPHQPAVRTTASGQRRGGRGDQPRDGVRCGPPSARVTVIGATAFG